MYVSFNIIKVMSRWWMDNIERLCPMKHRTVMSLNSATHGIRTRDLVIQSEESINLGGVGVEYPGDNCGTGVRASISKPTPFIYLKKRTHSYTWSSKMLTYSYTAFWFFIPTRKRPGKRGFYIIFWFIEQIENWKNVRRLFFYYYLFLSVFNIAVF